MNGKREKYVHCLYGRKKRIKSFSSHFRLSEGKSFVLSDFLIGT
jgi:hypothetical protein